MVTTINTAEDDDEDDDEDGVNDDEWVISSLTHSTDASWSDKKPVEKAASAQR